MCLAIPGRIVRIEHDGAGVRSADVEYPGQVRRVSLLYLPDAHVGDHVLVQAGFGIRLLTASEAQEVVRALEAAASLASAAVPREPPA